MSTRRKSNISQLKAASLAVLPDLVQQWLPAGEFRGEIYVALNPLRKDRNLGSFQIDTSTGRWYDYSIGRGGSDAVSLYAYLNTGADYGKALKLLAADPLITAAIATGATPANPTKVAKNSAAKLAKVHSIYNRASALQGTPAAAYLQSRGLRPTDAWDRLRASVLYYPRVGRHPVLIAPIDALDGSLAGLHRTYLRPDGTKLDVLKPRMSLGRVHGCAIRLGEATDELIICEGLEDGLTLYQELGCPVWVAGGANFLPLMAIPPTIRRLTIAADNDGPGKQGAQRAADKLDINGRDLRIMQPDEKFKDFNDQLRGIKS